MHHFDFRKRSHLQPLAHAATCCYLPQPLALQPLADWQFGQVAAASGCRKWLQQLAAWASGCQWLPVAAWASSCKWLSGGCKWLQVAGSGWEVVMRGQRPLAANRNCSHLQPSAARSHLQPRAILKNKRHCIVCSRGLAATQQQLLAAIQICIYMCVCIIAFLKKQRVRLPVFEGQRSKNLLFFLLFSFSFPFLLLMLLLLFSFSFFVILFLFFLLLLLLLVLVVVLLLRFLFLFLFLILFL